jgi:hypothetical protein
MVKPDLLRRVAKKRSLRDQLATRGQLFVASRLAAIGLEFVPAGDKTPSVDGYAQIHDGTTNLHFTVQVKAGQSHLRKRTATLFQVKLDASDVEDWHETNTAVFVVWVDAAPGTDESSWVAYWETAHMARRTSIRIRKTHRLDERALIPIAALVRAHAGRADGARIASHPLFPARASEVKPAAWRFFCQWRREGSVSSLFGDVAITRRAWRHLTRVARPQREVAHKLSLLPCAREIIESTKHAEFRRRIAEGGAIIDYYAVSGVYKAVYRRDLLVEAIIEVVRSANAKRRQGQARFLSVYERRR